MKKFIWIVFMKIFYKMLGFNVIFIYNLYGISEMVIKILLGNIGINLID